MNIVQENELLEMMAYEPREAFYTLYSEDTAAHNKDDLSIYSSDTRASMLDDDELSASEEGFMNGYEDLHDKDAFT